MTFCPLKLSLVSIIFFEIVVLSLFIGTVSLYNTSIFLVNNFNLYGDDIWVEGTLYH